MNEFIRILKDRRSVRQYTDKTIEKRILEEIIDCARLAPSARNLQQWRFIVVTEKGKLLKLSEHLENGKFIKDAGACIAVCGGKKTKRYVEDGCLASENIMLAAKSLGVGSCYVAALGKEIDKARDLLNVPEDFEIVCFISLGYFEKNSEIHGKKKLEEVIRWEKF